MNFCNRCVYPDVAVNVILDDDGICSACWVFDEFSELTEDQSFWKGCQTCKNYDVLQRTNQTMCLCTGMLFDSNQKTKSKRQIHKYDKKVWERLKNIKQSMFFKKNKK